jgi:hypothetical protein
LNNVFEIHKSISIKLKLRYLLSFVWGKNKWKL